MLRRAPAILQVDVRVSLAEVQRRLASSMGIVKNFLLSPTWGRAEDFVGHIIGSEFRMRVRHSYSNGFTRLLCGKVTPASFGCRIEGQFRTLRFVVLTMRASWLLILVPMALYFVDLLRHARVGRPVDWWEVGISISIPLATFAFLIVIEIIARRMGDRDEIRMREHLMRLFADVRRS